MRAGIGVFDMTICSELSPEPDTESLQPPPCAEQPKPEPPKPADRQPCFERGAVPEYELEEPALDRYRDYAGIEPFDLLGDECLGHEPLCRSETSPTIHRVPPQTATILYALTLPNINRFSKLDHCANQEKLCNDTITKDRTTRQAVA